MVLFQAVNYLYILSLLPQMRKNHVKSVQIDFVGKYLFIYLFKCFRKHPSFSYPKTVAVVCLSLLHLCRIADTMYSLSLGSGRPAETSLLACKWLEVHRIKYSNRAECCRKLMKALLNLEVYTPF